MKARWSVGAECLECICVLLGTGSSGVAALSVEGEMPSYPEFQGGLRGRTSHCTIFKPFFLTGKNELSSQIGATLS